MARTMNGGGLSDAQIAAMSSMERRQLVHRLQPAPETDPTRRIRLWVTIAAAIGLIPWIAYLALTLPENYVAHNWRATWVGFDLLLLVFMIATTVLGLLHRLTDAGRLHHRDPADLRCLVRHHDVRTKRHVGGGADRGAR